MTIKGEIVKMRREAVETSFLSRNTRSSGQDSNPGSPRYESGVPATTPRRLVMDWRNVFYYHPFAIWNLHYEQSNVCCSICLVANFGSTYGCTLYYLFQNSVICMHTDNMDCVLFHPSSALVRF